jgi:hypothetical protein
MVGKSPKTSNKTNSRVVKKEFEERLKILGLTILQNRMKKGQHD